MNIMFLAAASLLAAPAGAFQGSNMPDRCKAMDVLMGVHRAEPAKPQRSPEPGLLPKAQIESTGPAVLVPDCNGDETRQRKKDRFSLA